MRRDKIGEYSKVSFLDDINIHKENQANQLKNYYNKQVSSVRLPKTK